MPPRSPPHPTRWSPRVARTPAKRKPQSAVAQALDSDWLRAGRLQMEIGLNDEFLPRALDALAALRSQGELHADLELRLLTLLCLVGGQCLLDRAIPAEAPAQLEALARRIGSPEQQRLAFFALCANAFGRGDYPTVVARAARYDTLPRDPLDPAHAAATLAAWRFDALGRHYLGEHAAAWKRSAARVLEHAGPWRAGSLHADAAARVHGHPAGPDPLAAGLCRRGARAGARPAALLRRRPPGRAQPGACRWPMIPILLWRGDDERALSFLARLVDHELSALPELTGSRGRTAYCKVLALRGHDVQAMRVAARRHRAAPRDAVRHALPRWPPNWPARGMLIAGRGRHCRLVRA